MKNLSPKQMLAAIAKLTAENEKLRAKRKQANVNGGSKEVDRGNWCTPKAWAERVGPWDVDPFSNPRSHIVADATCQLERGDNGLPPDILEGGYLVAGVGQFHANKNTRVWLQPPYEIVLEVLAHYGHTRFGALLRFDPSTEWFCRLYSLSALVCVPRRQRIEFEPPPGVKASKNPYPHALYYAREEDATPAVLRACFAWRTR